MWDRAGRTLQARDSALEISASLCVNVLVGIISCQLDAFEIVSSPASIVSVDGPGATGASFRRAIRRIVTSKQV